MSIKKNRELMVEQIKRLRGELNEAAVNVEYKVMGKVTYSGPMFKRQSSDAGKSENDVAYEMANDLGLRYGFITWTDNTLTIEGETYSGGKVDIKQSGEYSKSGGPYSPKMGKFTAKLDGKNVASKVQGEFNSYGSFDNGPDLSRTDIYGDVFRYGKRYK